MPNNYFRFKQFTVFQDRCAMKVCTDACLFGAWVSSVMHVRDIDVLDIGTGTGLLSLMLAQQLEGNIDAIEVDKSAFEQARQNFSSSPWGDRISAFLDHVQSFRPSKKYDLVICNPPFYENELKSPDHRRNMALHDAGLTIAELVPLAKAFLKADGRFAVLLPAARAQELESLASTNQFKIAHKALVKQTRRHSPFRVMYILRCGEAKSSPLPEEIIIKEEDAYTSEFYSLLKDYYLFEPKTI
jgi:tRNA1Val (adenine37-N6)-methyltransferase